MDNEHDDFEEFVRDVPLVAERCLCGNVLLNICYDCGCVSNNIFKDFVIDEFDGNCKKKYRSVHKPEKYMRAFLMSLKFLSMAVEGPDLNILAGVQLNVLKKYIYTNHPDVKGYFRHIYAKLNGINYLESDLSLERIYFVSNGFANFKKFNKFPNRIMFLYIFHKDIFDHYKDVLSVLKDTRPYHKFIQQD